MSTCVWYLSAVVQILLGGGFKTFRWWAALSVSMYHVTNFHRDPKTVKTSVSPVEKKNSMASTWKWQVVFIFIFNQTDWHHIRHCCMLACVWYLQFWQLWDGSLAYCSLAPRTRDTLFLHRAFKLPPISCNDKFGSRSKRNMQYIARVQFWKKMSFRDKFNGERQSGFGCLNRTSSMNWISWLAHRSSSGSPSFWVPSIAGQCFKMFLWRHGHSAELLVGKVCKPAVWQQHLT